MTGRWMRAGRAGLAAVVLAMGGTGLAGPPAAIRQDGTLLVDGRPLFPIGIVAASLGENLDHCAELGFDVVVGSGEVPPAFYDKAASLGLHVIAGHYIWATFAGHDPRMDLFQHEKAGFDLAFEYRNQGGMTPLEMLAAYKDHPSVVGWYVFEEPKANYSEPLEHMYELFKSHAPERIVTGVSAEAVWYHHFRNAVDVLMVDCYPYRPPGLAQPEVLTYDLTREAIDVMRGKPVWLMAQGGCLWKGTDDFPLLTEANYRNQAYLGLIAGAKGYVLFSYASVTHFGRLADDALRGQWERIRAMVAELRALSPFLCDGRVSDKVRVAWQFPGGRGVPPLTRLLEYYGRHYLLVANIGREPAEAHILGTDYGFLDAFDVRLFSGAPGMSVASREEAVAGQTVNESPVGEYPRIVIPPDCSGTFEILRRPAQPPQPAGQ